MTVSAVRSVPSGALLTVWRAVETKFKVTEDDGHESGAELTNFLDAEWNAWHAREGHDPNADWTGSDVTFVARDAAGTIVGAAIGRYSVGVGHLSELMIAEQLRGEGLGTELVRRFEERCWSAGCHKLTVHTDYGGPADEFYRRLGWSEEAVLRRDRGGRDFVRLCKFKAE